MHGLRAHAARVLSTLLLWLASLAAHAGAVSLTPEERAWLDRQGPLRVATKQEWAPIDTYSYEGQYRGLSGEFVHLIGQRLGVRLEYVALPTWPRAWRRCEAAQTSCRRCRARASASGPCARPALPRHTQRLRGAARRRPGRREGADARDARGGRARLCGDRRRARARRRTHRRVRRLGQGAARLSQGAADVYMGALPTTTFLVEKLLLPTWRSARHGPPGSARCTWAWRRPADAQARARQGAGQHLAGRPAGDPSALGPLRTSLTEPSPPLPLSAEEREVTQQMPALRVGFDDAHRPYTFSTRMAKPAAWRSTT